MYDIRPGAAADLGLGRVQFRPAVVIAPFPSYAGQFGRGQLPRGVGIHETKERLAA